MKMSFRLLGCLALVFLIAVPAEAGLFGRCGGGLFGGRLRQRAAASSCYSAQSQGFQSFQSFESYQSYQGGVTPSLQSFPAYPTKQAPPAQFQNCPSGQCPTSYSAPTSAPTTLESYLYQLNALRASRGLRAVVFDQQLYNDAFTNSVQQTARGLGHFYMGRARRQNSGMGTLSSVFVMWQMSPAHMSALLDPNISRAAIAQNGAYWTFSAS